MGLLARSREGHLFEDPPVAKFLFGDTRMAWLWTVLRLYLGWSWLEAGEHKVVDPTWMSTGTALAGFWTRAVTVEGRPPIAYDWYRGFIQMLLDGGHYVWFAKVIAVGELLIGVALILGAFVGITAFFGAFMNWNFIMAGTASTNGLLLVLAVFLLLAWKIAGYWGLDRFLLPALGTPWAPGEVVRRDAPRKIEPVAERVT